MALRSNRNIASSEMISTLESEYGYRVSDSEELAIFLDHHREIYEPLVQASAAISESFPHRIATDIAISKDYEAEDAIVDGMPVIDVLLPNVSDDEQLVLINAFNVRWWAEHAKNSLPARELVFMIHSYD